MKKVIILASLIFAFSAASSVAFAEEGVTTTTNPTPVQAASTVTVTSDGINKSDPVYIQVKAKYETLKGLREQQSNVSQDIKNQSKLNGETEKKIREAIKAELKASREKFQGQIKASQDEIKPLLEQRKDLQAKALAAKQAQDKTTLQTLKQQLTDLNSQIKAKQEAAKTLRENVKNQMEANKTILTKAKEQNVKIGEIRTQMMQINVDIHALQVEKEKEWLAFASSMKAKDLSGANTHMENIVKFKQQIIDKMTSVLLLKKQVTDILNVVNAAN